jgi:hypothetical protein
MNVQHLATNERLGRYVEDSPRPEVSKKWGDELIVIDETVIKGQHHSTWFANRGGVRKPFKKILLRYESELKLNPAQLFRKGITMKKGEMW